VDYIVSSSRPIISLVQKSLVFWFCSHGQLSVVYAAFTVVVYTKHVLQVVIFLSSACHCVGLLFHGLQPVFIIDRYFCSQFISEKQPSG